VLSGAQRVSCGRFVHAGQGGRGAQVWAAPLPLWDSHSALKGTHGTQLSHTTGNFRRDKWPQPGHGGNENICRCMHKAPTDRSNAAAPHWRGQLATQEVPTCESGY